MQLHYLLVVVVVSDIKIMSSTVAVICTVNQLLSYYTSCKQLQYPIRTEYFWTELNSFQTKSEILQKNWTENEQKFKNLLRTSLDFSLNNQSECCHTTCYCCYNGNQDYRLVCVLTCRLVRDLCSYSQSENHAFINKTTYLCHRMYMTFAVIFVIYGCFGTFVKHTEMPPSYTNWLWWHKVNRLQGHCTKICLLWEDNFKGNVCWCRARRKMEKTQVTAK